MIRKIIAIALVLIGTSVVAHADEILAAGALYGGPTQSSANCYVFNADVNPITVVSTKIHGEFNDPPPFYADCGTSLGGGLICGAVAATIRNDQAYACRVVVIGSKTNLRGILEIRDSSGKVLANTDLR